MNARTNPSPSQDLWPAWRSAATQPAIDAAIADLYKRLDADIASRSPTCWVSGRCCNFDAFGHKLYVTGLEIAWMLAKVPREEPPHADWPARLTVDGTCPFQVSRLCTVHTIRPLGCRIFFCQQGTEGWQQELYESYLTDLRRLHDEHALEYRYMEWRGGLRDAVTASDGGLEKED